MARADRLHWAGAIVLTLAALLTAQAAGAATLPVEPGGSVERGHRLAQAWCKQCHAVEATTVRPGNTAPDFMLIANQPSTTALGLKVFLRTNHPSMPNLIIEPNDADDLVQYILGLKRN